MVPGGIGRLPLNSRQNLPRCRRGGGRGVPPWPLGPIGPRLGPQRLSCGRLHLHAVLERHDDLRLKLADTDRRGSLTLTIRRKRSTPQPARLHGQARRRSSGPCRHEGL